MRFFYFSIITKINTSIRRLIKWIFSGTFWKLQKKKPWYVISIAFHLGTLLEMSKSMFYSFFFFTVSRKKDSCLFFQFTRYLRNLLKLSKPQQLYNRAKARSKVRKLMVLFCLNTKPVRKKDYPTLSQPWSLLIANH